MYNIPSIPNKIMKVIYAFDYLKDSGRNYIPMVILKKCEPELFLCIWLICPIFPGCWKASFVALKFKKLREREKSMAKNECLKSRLSSVSKKLKRKGFC